MAGALLLLGVAVAASAEVPVDLAKRLRGSATLQEASGKCEQGDRVRCPFSDTMCAGNQCCPRAVESGNKSYPCPSAADAPFAGWEMDAKPAGTSCFAPGCITQADMDATIDAFMHAVVSIGQHFGNCTAAKEAALGSINAAYAYDVPGVTVLFKPTLTEFPHVYRPTKEWALSYFIGECVCPGATNSTFHDVACGEAQGYLAPDSGFAFAANRGWAKVERGGAAKGGRQGSGFWYNLDGPFCHAAQA